MPLGCVINSNYHMTLLLYTVVPMVFGSLNFLLYLILKRRNKIDASNTVYMWLILMTFLILPAVSTVIFTTFACTTFDGDYGRYLKADLSINCDSPEHKFYEAFATVCIIVYPIGVPLLYAVNLWSNRALLDPGQRRLVKDHGKEEGLKMALEERARLENTEEHRYILSLTFLYDSYEPKYFYFEVVETIRKLFLTGGLVLLGPGTGEQQWESVQGA